MVPFARERALRDLGWARDRLATSDSGCLFPFGFGSAAAFASYAVVLGQSFGKQFVFVASLRASLALDVLHK